MGDGEGWILGGVEYVWGPMLPTCSESKCARCLASGWWLLPSWRPSMDDKSHTLKMPNLNIFTTTGLATSAGQARPSKGRLTQV